MSRRFFAIRIEFGLDGDQAAENTVTQEACGDDGDMNDVELLGEAIHRVTCRHWEAREKDVLIEALAWCVAESECGGLTLDIDAHGNIVTNTEASKRKETS